MHIECGCPLSLSHYLMMCVPNQNNTSVTVTFGELLRFINGF